MAKAKTKKAKKILRHNLPQGKITGYKKAYDETGENYTIVTLEIPSDADAILAHPGVNGGYSDTGKARAAKAKVIKIDLGDEASENDDLQKARRSKKAVIDAAIDGICLDTYIDDSEHSEAPKKSKSKSLKVAVSGYDSGFEYKVGETVEPANGFDKTLTGACAGGIHFFLTKAEAEGYHL